MKAIRPPFTWPTLVHDFNAAAIRSYDVLNQQEAFIKKLKKKHATKEEFAVALRRTFKRQYWLRTEYEMIVYIENDRVYIEPFVGSFKDGRVDITDNELLNWHDFATTMLRERAWYDRENDRQYVKFDVYDQLLFRFDELINFVWNYRHKYQRVKKGN